MKRMETSGDAYLTEIIKTRTNITSIQGILGYKGEVNGQEVSITIPSDRRMTIQVGTEQIFNVAYMYGLSGIQFYQPIEIGGNEISGLEWSETNNSFMWNENTLEQIPDPIYPKYLKYLGNYNMNYFYGQTERNITVKLIAKKFNGSEKSYELQGLPFPLQVSYNVEQDCLEILTYQKDGYYVAVWEVIGNGTLSWAGGLGLIGKLKEGTSNVYEFVDNGVWGTNIARSLILRSASGEYKGFGGDTRFQNIILTKIQ